MGLGSLDRRIFDAVAEAESPLLDTVMPKLTSAADHSKLWMAIAAALTATGSPSMRRGAGRGLCACDDAEGTGRRLAPEANIWFLARPLIDARLRVSWSPRTGTRTG